MSKSRWCYLQITSDMRVRIDRQDFERVSARTWRLLNDRSKRLCIVTSIRTERGVRNVHLARFIVKAPAGKYVCLRDLDRPHDFRRENIAVCTLKERQRMTPKRRSGGTSRFRGVSLSDGGWRASIQVNGRSFNLGTWPSEEAAANAYNRASARHFGEFGFQNDI